MQPIEINKHQFFKIELLEVPLSIMKMQQSMSRKGDCWDNAPTERFFRSLKYEQLNYEKFRTKASAKFEMV